MRGEPAGRSSDIFALGCVLYQMAAGNAPFARRTPNEILAAILRDDPVPLAQTGKAVPEAFERLVLSCLAKDAAQRPSAAGVAVELKALATAPVTFHLPVARPRITQRRIMAEVLRQGGFVEPGLILVVYAELRDVDEAFRWAEKAYQSRSSLLVFARVEPKLNSLREDPRFTDLLLE